MSQSSIPRIERSAPFAGDGAARVEFWRGVAEVGVLVVHDAPGGFALGPRPAHPPLWALDHMSRRFCETYLHLGRAA